MAKTNDLDKLQALKAEIEALKSKRPISKKKVSEPTNVQDSMEKLTQTLNEFMQTFEEATEEMRIEEKEEELFIKEIKPLHEKMDKIIEQNEKIAKGIIAVANMLNSDIPFIKRMVAASAGPVKPIFEKPSFGNMPQIPRPGAPKPGPKLTGAPMPPPPKPMERKKKFSDLFK